MKAVHIILGAGGVGKTTVAAALALSLAEKHPKGALFTVDPSLRLCQTLGLKKLSLECTKLENSSLEAYGLETHNALRTLLLKVIHDEQKVEKIVSHRLFKVIEGNISHLDHFLAMEKIVELTEREDLDFLVVDTPPHEQAFEFFESPKVLSSFLDKSFLSVLANPDFVQENFFLKIFSRAMDEGWKLFKSLLGEGFWDELAELLGELMPLRERLLEASVKMDRLLKAQNTQAMLVSIPEHKAVQSARQLSADWSSKLGLKIHGLCLNKAFPLDISCPVELEGTLFAERWKLQQELYNDPFFMSFTKLYRIPAFAPRTLNLEKLKEMGHEFIY